MKFDLLKKIRYLRLERELLPPITGNWNANIYASGYCCLRKRVHQRELKEDINPDIILGNTYHLYLRPQTEILESGWFAQVYELGQKYIDGFWRVPSVFLECQ
jgi:queuine tRNA-ribosyltransferase